jgi:hypothetical protein
MRVAGTELERKHYFATMCFCVFVKKIHTETWENACFRVENLTSSSQVHQPDQVFGQKKENTRQPLT